MVYVEGFVIPVPVANKAAYLEHASRCAPFLKEFGVSRMVEGWGDEVPDGKVTDFKRAVQAQDGEVVLFSWFEYLSRAVRDAADRLIMNDPRMKELAASLPFDGQRMFFAGFAGLVEEAGEGKMGYVDGIVVPVPLANKDAYREFAQKNARILREFGATRVVEAWGDDLPDGKVTDFKRAVQATAAENVAYSWIEWPSKALRDAAWKKIMADERMKPDHAKTLFDGKRMIYGGFSPILDV